MVFLLVAVGWLYYGYPVVMGTPEEDPLVLPSLFVALFAVWLAWVAISAKKRLEEECKAASTMIVFELGRDGYVTEKIGPFPFVKLTCEGIRVGPDGHWLAYDDGGIWTVKPDEALIREHPEIRDYVGQEFSDITIFNKGG